MQRALSIVLLVPVRLRVFAPFVHGWCAKWRDQCNSPAVSLCRSQKQCCFAGHAPAASTAAAKSTVRLPLHATAPDQPSEQM